MKLKVNIILENGKLNPCSMKIIAENVEEIKWIKKFLAMNVTTSLEQYNPYECDSTSEPLSVVDTNDSL